MNWSELISLLSDPQGAKEIIKIGGLVAVTLIVFAETGLFFCFWLPGDYLLFTAGVLAGTGTFPVSIFTLCFCLLAAAVLGNYTGYWFGSVLGHKLQNRPDTWYFKQAYLHNTRKVFDKYGGSALVLGRFLPVIRTFAPILAGIIHMKMATFAFFNILGAALWVILLCVGGFILGEIFHHEIEQYLPYIIIGFLSFTTVTLVRGWFKVRNDARKG